MKRGGGNAGRWWEDNLAALIAAAATIAAAVIGAVMVKILDDQEVDPLPAPVPRPTPLDPITIPAVDKQSSFTQVGARPLSLAAGDRKIWIADPTRTEAWWLDATEAPTTHLKQLPDIEQRRDRPIRPVGVAVADGAAWFVDEEHDLLWRIDEGTNAVDDPTPVGDRPGGVAVDGNVVWVLSRSSAAVQRVDASSRTLLGESIDLSPGNPRAITAREGVAWVVGTSEHGRGAVWRVAGEAEPEPTTGLRNAAVVAVAATDDAVWIADGAGNVSRIDPDQNAVVDTSARLAGRPCGIAVDKDAVWVTDSDGDQIWRLDPDDARFIGHPIRVEAHPCAVTLKAGTAWVGNQGDNSISRVTP